ncbi:uncharacterized protein N7496_012430 [Penicillium cataractarum]|uniref:Mis18 domain-containing protein n=1 Tax=Penicillium cataractarum TaxID=2100454 RepID=A0A9W9R7Z8_9EURO|nr:uncharacterized protein N7496_012430 [Penicillium cataractarum]KAJ5355218.1 hypothetical protein N7496_012430 [Penicillium cataractarum]
MDLNDLTRPAILCQCLRCSSSLAVLENEWGKLSSVYGVATAWLSVNLQRISISSEQKHIPQTSEMSLLRGRIAQDVSCKLCQQKLAVLCGLDNGPNILWKMSKVSFREIVTMRTADPLFKDGALDKLLPPPPPKPPRHSAQDNALVPSGAQDLFSLDPAMHQQMQHQGRSIDQISNSVNHLQDTMADLKHSFTSLRIELNGPSRSISDHGSISDPGFDMIATVLKELKSKSDEIEKLTLEIEALKLKNRFMEERKPASPEYPSQTNGRIADVQSPGLLQAGRKRAWPDAFSTGPPTAIADSFDEEDMVDDLPLENLPTYNVRVPPKQPTRQLPSGPAQLRIEARQNDSTPTSTPPASHPQQNVAKRPRLTQTKDSQLNSEKPRGRPRKSNVAEPQAEPTTASTSQNSSIQVPIAPSSPDQQTTKRRRLRRSTRSQSFGPTSMPAQVEAGETPAQEPSPTNGAESNGNHDAQQNGESASATAKGSAKNGAKTAEEARVTEEEKRKAKIAARDAMTRRAMEQEERMETDGSR